MSNPDPHDQERLDNAVSKALAILADEGLSHAEMANVAVRMVETIGHEHGKVSEVLRLQAKLMMDLADHFDHPEEGGPN